MRLFQWIDRWVIFIASQKGTSYRESQLHRQLLATNRALDRCRQESLNNYHLVGHLQDQLILAQENLRTANKVIRGELNATKSKLTKETT